ncbi:amidohydrolase family protein [Candidatus Sumerlaeota bacterium]|nr:amidohydrolase family protein [Candidatus Sumerlaeota bacterium]
MSGELTRRRFLAGGMAAGASILSARIQGAGQQAAATSAAPDQANWIVDSHAHLKHGDAARTEYSPEVIVDTMDKVGIAKSVVFAMSTTTQRSIEMAERAVKKYPDRLIPYVYALPHYERPVIKEIERALSGGLFRGIKIHVGECTLADYVIDPVLKLAGKRNVPCLIDLGGRYADAKRMAAAFPETKLIVAHMGRYLSTDRNLIDQFIGLAENCANVLLDVSGVVVLEKIVEAVRKIGSTRLIWGTDGPHEKPDTVGFARTELNKITQLDLPEQDKRNILRQSIVGLLRL